MRSAGRHFPLAVSEAGRMGALPHRAAAAVLHAGQCRAVHVYRQHHRAAVFGGGDGGAGTAAAF